MHRAPKILLASVAAIVALLALILVLLSVFDWNRLKPRISDTVSEATGREFSIDGDLSLSWTRPDQPFDGWRRWVPWPSAASTHGFPVCSLRQPEPWC